MITDTVYFSELIAQHEDELAELRESYNELRDRAESEFGESKIQWPDNFQQTALLFEETAKRIQRRIELLNRFQDEYGDEGFTIRMPTAAETAEIETTLKKKAQKEDVDMEAINHERDYMVVDTVVEDAPEGFPTDDDGSPKPSDAPNALVLSLYEAVENFIQAGDSDFRASGFGEPDDLDLPETFNDRSSSNPS